MEDVLIPENNRNAAFEEDDILFAPCNAVTDTGYVIAMLNPFRMLPTFKLLAIS